MNKFYLILKRVLNLTWNQLNQQSPKEEKLDKIEINKYKFQIKSIFNPQNVKNKITIIIDLNNKININCFFIAFFDYVM